MFNINGLREHHRGEAYFTFYVRERILKGKKGHASSSIEKKRPPGKKRQKMRGRALNVF